MHKRMRKEAQRRTNPLSQKWFRDRQRHISKSQRAALRELFPLYGLVVPHGQELSLPLARHHERVVLDVGFGVGESLVDEASRHPQDLFVGVEIMKSGIATALKEIAGRGLQNVRVVRCDATRVFRQLPVNSIDEVLVGFPDPWLAERDAGRRMLRDDSLLQLHRCLRVGGKVVVRTDVSAYADYVRSLFASPMHRGQWEKTADLQYAPACSPGERATSKYELRAEAGSIVHDLTFQILAQL